MEDKIKSIGSGMIKSSTPLVRHSLNTYAYNLVQVHELSKEFLYFLLSLIDIRSQEKFLIYLNSKRKIKGSDKGIEWQCDTDELVENIMKAVVYRKMTITGKDIRLYFCNLFKKKCKKVTPQGRHGISRRLKELQDIFELSREEINMVCLLYCHKQYVPLENMCNSYNMSSFFKFAAVAVDCPVWRLKRLLAHKGRLVSSGIIDHVASELRPPFSLENEIIGYLAGIADVPLAERYCKRDRGRTHDLESFRISDQSIKIICSLLSRSNSCNILFHGQAGTGKTEFAKSIIAAAGKQAFFAQYGEQQTRTGVPGPNRKIALQAALACVSPGKGVLVVDEADEILNTKYFMFGSNKALNKGWLNMFLDNSNHHIIWITNHTDYMEESTQRRFAYSLRFRQFTRRDREEIWKSLLKRHPLRRFVTENTIREMSVTYQANASGIASALDTLKTVVPRKQADKEIVRSTLAELLEKHEEATGRRKATRLGLLTDHYDVSALNIDIDGEKIIRSLREFVSRKMELGEKFRANINLLFWGVPGTGKTEFAKYLANETSMGLLIKRASDLISMWVGDTESNIRSAFEEADRDKSILFLDEADSFFINRETAVRSWETSQTNELLTQMENHRGILICCTNMLEHLDRAVMRRFAWKIEFKPLTSGGKLKVYQKYFPCIRQLKENDKQRLASVHNLTPGDIKAVWQKFQYVKQDNLNHEVIIHSLEDEVRYKEGQNGKIGF